MAPKPHWWHTLQEARRQACLAIDFYNRSGDKRSFHDFVIHMHLAWQNLLHADFERRKVNIYYRDSRGRYTRGKDGERRSWELQECLKKEYKENDPVRANVEFFIGLRNKIEHRFQNSFVIATAAHAHALVINFETELVSRFGDIASLADELRFPVFVQSLTPAGMEQQRQLRRRLPAAAKAYITAFEARLDPEVRGNERYIYRVQLIQMKGSGSEADLAVTFVRANELTVEERASLELLGKEGKVVVAEKQRDVGLNDELLPKQAAAAIEARLPFEFKVSHFTKMRTLHGIRPQAGQPPEATETRYCIYSRPYDNYVYTPAYIARCVRELDSPEKFRNKLDMEPKYKSARVQSLHKVADSKRSQL